MTACALAVASVLTLGPLPASAATDAFVTAENARLGRQRRVAQLAPPSIDTRQGVYDERAEILAELAASRFTAGLQLADLAGYRELHERLRRPIDALDTLEVEVQDTIADIESRREDLVAVQSGLVDPVALEEFGLDFAAFPVEAPSEFVDSWGASRSGGRSHKGTDILGPYGTELRAIEDGVIERWSNSSLGGLSLYLQGDSGARYFYAHLSALADVGEGDRVHAGQVIGFNGDSGNARGTPHLHFQWAPDGGEGWQNPFALLTAIWAQDRQIPLPQR